MVAGAGSVQPTIDLVEITGLTESPQPNGADAQHQQGQDSQAVPAESRNAFEEDRVGDGAIGRLAYGQGTVVAARIITLYRVVEDSFPGPAIGCPV